MREKTLAGGKVGYFWALHERWIKRGFTIASEALGQDYGAARERAEMLNRLFNDWRVGRGEGKSLDRHPGVGTVEWMVERYKRDGMEDVSERSRYEYERALNMVLRLMTTIGTEVGAAPIKTMTTLGVEKIYKALKKGTRVKVRLRQANVCMIRMSRAWDYVFKRYPNMFPVPAVNPFRAVELKHGKATTKPASRAEAYALHGALVAAGEPHLAAVPLICLEWHQRPENVLAGHLTWADYRPLERPNAVRVLHHKTGEVVWLPLVGQNGEPFFPELTAYLDTLERLGVPIVLMQPKPLGDQIPGPAKPFLLRTARTRVRRAAQKAGLPDWLTLAACRHGGLTELGDAGLTESAVIALSGHRTAEAARGYVKRTEAQREAGLLKRRAWVQAVTEESAAENKKRPSVGMAPLPGCRNESC
jgi:hypothetical protein